MITILRNPFAAPAPKGTPGEFPPRAPIVALDMPQAQERRTFAVTPGSSFRSTFPVAGARLEQEGNALVLSSPEGGSIALADFFTFYSSFDDNRIQFYFDDDSFAIAEFFEHFAHNAAALELQDPAPEGASSGLSAYVAVLASLVEGVEALGVLDAASEGSRTFHALPEYNAQVFGSGGGAGRLTGNSATSGGKSSTGDGGDTVIFNGNLEDVTVNLGGGDDILRLESGGIGSGTLLLGGENDAIDFERGKLGDILSLGHSIAEKLSGPDALGGISPSTVKGFETLHLDLTGGDGIVDVNTFLQTLTNKGFTGSNAFAGAVITGGERDGALLNSGSWTKAQSGVALDNFDGLTFDRFTVINGLDTLEIYVQSGML